MADGIWRHHNDRDPPQADAQGEPVRVGRPGGERAIRSAVAGATLLFGPRAARPDLVLAGQFLIDDLRAEGSRISGIQVNSHTLRLRIAGAELALALSAGPLPARSLQGLRRPAGRGPGRPQLPAQMPATADDRADPERDSERDSDGAPDAPLLTDLGTIRVLRALRQHQAALGVLLRSRGQPGPTTDMDDLLMLMLKSLIEAAPPTLVLWQRSGLVYTGCEFAAQNPRDLMAPVGPVRALSVPEHFDPPHSRSPAAPTPPPPETAPGAELDAELGAEPVAAPGATTVPVPIPGSAATAPPGSPPTDRADRARRRSAGRLFRRGKDQSPAPGTRRGSRPRAAALPQLTAGSASLAAALRDSSAGTGTGTGAGSGAGTPAPAPRRRLRKTMLLGLWFSVILPNWVALQALMAP